MSNTIQLLINTGNEATSRLIEVPKAVAGQSPAMRIEAVRGARYEITDPVLKSAPDVVRAKRVGKDLHVSLDDDDTAEFILEDYYEADVQTENAGLFGRAEDGTLSQYIPEDPVNSALTANLPDGGVATAQVLGVPAQEGFVLSALPLAAGGLGGWLAGGGAVAAAAAAGGGGGGGGGVVVVTPTTTVEILSISEDTGVSDEDFITNRKDPETNEEKALTISGKLSAALTTGETLHYSKDNGQTWTDITSSVKNGTEVSHVDAQLTSSTTILMRVQHSSGGNGASDSQAITIDTVAPAPVGDPSKPADKEKGEASITLNNVTADNTINANESTQDTVAVSGKVSGEFRAGDKVILRVNNEDFEGAVSESGDFSINVKGANLLADENKTIDATFKPSDIAGNVGNISANKTYDINTTEPTTTVDIKSISEDTGSSGTDFITKDNNGLNIIAKLGAALADGEKLFYTKDGNNWVDITSSVTGTDVSHTDANLTSSATIQMRVQNAVGNNGPAASQLITIDTVAPNPIVSPEDPTNPPAGKTSITLANITSDNILTAAEGAQSAVAVSGTVRGEFKLDDKVTLQVNGKSFEGNVAANGSFSINVNGADLLADGDKKIEASVAATDVAGNVNAIDTVNDISTSKSYLVPTVQFLNATKDEKNGTEQRGHVNVTDTDDVITYQVTFSEAIDVTGALADVKLDLVVGAQTRQATATALSADNKSITFSYTVIDADFDHNGVQSGDIKVINGSKITTSASMVNTVTISLTGVKGTTVDTIDNTSILFIGGQKVGENWFYLRDQNLSGTADGTDLFNGAPPANPPTATGFSLTSITAFPTGIANWDIPGWAALNKSETAVDDRNVWVGSTLLNVGTGLAPTDGSTSGYYIYQVI